MQRNGKFPHSDHVTLLAGKLVKFLEDYESEDHLLIVYYGGHGAESSEHAVVACVSLSAVKVLTRGRYTLHLETQIRILNILQEIKQLTGLETKTWIKELQSKWERDEAWI